ncbi:unnamed protein product [Cuscuta europaea]|uniref:DNA helicase Pif1-like 2B domain-containing protein n=1 Tax=Cuscuta europaea TaxID=41803 RepID=A0A9P0Z7P0_CUSEU|nr:unnamed protein product [Cuscuta europaea]
MKRTAQRKRHISVQNQRVPQPHAMSSFRKFTPEFLNGIKCSGVPSHELKLKVGVPVMLMRNIDHSAGLCNGTRLLVTKLGEHIIEAQMMYGTNAGEKFLIPRISLTPTDVTLPFTFMRRGGPVPVRAWAQPCLCS